eukprot:gene3868-4123_t
MGVGSGPTRASAVTAGPTGGSFSKKKLLTSAKDLASNVGGALSNVSGALASAASTGLGAIALPKYLDAPPPPRAQLPATLKQELVCTLLEVLSQHPSAEAALKLPPGKPSQVVLWLGAAVAALQHTRACLHWEPLVPPPMPGQPAAPPLPPLVSVNLTTVPVDLWLQLLQASCHAVRGVVRLHGYDSLKSIYRANGGCMLVQLSPWDTNRYLSHTCESAAAALQDLLARELGDWRGLALAVRPRVLWVAAHYLELPAMLDETWGVLLGCVEDALLRAGKAESDGRARQLAASARDGLLLKKFVMPQLVNAGPRDRSGAQTTFDAAAASALVEMPEYRADALQVGLTVLQYLVWVVQSQLAASAAGPGVPPGPAEAVLAKKLLDLVKAIAASDSAATGAAAKAAALPSGYNAVAGFSALGFGGGDSSDEEDEGAVGLSREQRLQRKLGLAGSKGSKGKKSASSSEDEEEDGQSSGDDSASSKADSSDESSSSSGDESDSPVEAAAGGSSDEEDGQQRQQRQQRPNPLAGIAAAAAAAAATSSSAMKHRHSRKQDRKEQKKAAKAARKALEARAEARALMVGAPDSASGIWGYPFSGPRSQTLFISRRSRRHRLFNAESGFRLDQQGFWGSLPGGSSGWQELTGPNDPLVLTGRYSASEGAGSAAGEITVVLRAFNRLPIDLEGVEVAVRLVGSVRAERREASWMLPRLLPTEAAQHSFKMTPTGYGLMEVHTRLLLPVNQLASEAAAAAAPPALPCQPLVISMARLLRPPPCPPANAQEMLALWASLPVQGIRSGVAGPYSLLAGICGMTVTARLWAKTLLHPLVARLEQQLAAAAAVMPPPARVPPLVLPPAPRFTRKLRNKEDEEDSDAEDEELPFTPEEVAAHDQQLQKHKHECEKVSVSCLNSVAPPPLNWQMWCPGKDAKIMQWVDQHGATHRQITIRPQQNMTTTMAIWFLSTYLTGMLPPVVEFQGGKYYYYHLWHPLDHVESAWSFGPTVPGLQNGNIYTLIHERYRNPADWPYNRNYETNGWFFMEDPVQNMMLNRFHITMPILGLPTWNMIIEFNDVSGGLEVDIEIIAGIPPKGFDDRNPFGGFLAAGPLNELLTSPLLAKQKGTPDYDGAINAITRHVVEEFSNLQFFVPILYEKYTDMGRKGINWIPSIGDWMAASPHKITYELPAISLYDGLSAIAQLQIDKSNTTYAAVVDAAVSGSKAAVKGATDVVSIASVAKSQVYVQPANALTTLARNVNEVVGGWPEITPQSIVRFLAEFFDPDVFSSIDY